MPPLHPLVVHFPIALFVIAVVFDAWIVFSKNMNFNKAVRALMVFSWLGAAAAVLSGEWFEDERGPYVNHSLLHLHKLLAVGFCIWLTGLILLRLRKHWKPTKGYLSLAVLGVPLLMGVGHTGGTMAWPTMPTAAADAAQTVPTSGPDANAAGPSPSNAAPAVSNTTTPTSATNATAPTRATKPVTSDKTTRSNTTTKTTSVTKSSSTKTATSTTTVTHTTAPSLDQVMYSNGRQFFFNECGACHSTSIATQHIGSWSTAQWQATVARMQQYASGGITNHQASDIVYYLTHAH